MSTTTDRQIRYREAINEALSQEMERDPSIIIMGEEVAGGAGREHLGVIDAWGGPFRTTAGLILTRAASCLATSQPTSARQAQVSSCPAWGLPWWP